VTRVFLHVALERLEPGPERYSPRRTVLLVAPVPGTLSLRDGGHLRYRVIGGHDAYWRAIAAGEPDVFCEVIVE
jgi:hypothetical protein